MIWLRFILDFAKLLIDLSKKGSFCQKTILILFIFVSLNSYGIYYLFKKDQEKLSKFDSTANDTEVNSEIKKALIDCGDLSFITWSVLEDDATTHGKYLMFKTVYGCHRDRARYKDDCVVDIMFNNPIYFKKGGHFIKKETLDFIESDPRLPNGTYFEELTPVWFSLINKEGGDSKEANFLKENTGDFWNIINRTNLRLAEIGIIKVRHQNKFGKPVIYLVTFAFLPNAEKLCFRASDHLMNIAKRTIKGLR